MEEWTVLHLKDLPSASEFKACIELRNMPVVVEGAVKKWKAYSSWDTTTGGLQRLKDLAGTSTVQAMVSTSSNFFGDIRSHERIEIAFSQILDIAGARVQDSGAAFSTKVSESVRRLLSASDANMELGEDCDLSELQFYLAQVPMSHGGETVHAPLHRLMEDISLPEFLGSDIALSNVNFWMSVNGSRSSIHYDPFHNLLCVMVGSKDVTLWSPSAAASLYPLPIYGEASNHSSVNFVKPDYEVHPLFKEAMKHCQTVHLTSGDALFIPEGWYHQVNSEQVTIAVNVWWPSKISLALGTHMDGYYLRRVVASLVDSEKDLMLANFSTCDGGRRPERSKAGRLGQRSPAANTDSSAIQESLTRHDLAFSSRREVGLGPTNVAQESDVNVTVSDVSISLKNLSPLEAQYLRTIVLSVSSSLEDGAPAGPPCSRETAKTSIVQDSNASCHPRCQVDRNCKNLDSVAQVFHSLEPLALQRLLLILIEEFPHTLEALILYGLSPAAAEALTRKFDQMESSHPDSQTQFFKSFYKIFDDPNAAMTSLLNGKEAFAAQALKNVMEGMLGIHC